MLHLHRQRAGQNGGEGCAAVGAASVGWRAEVPELQGGQAGQCLVLLHPKGSDFSFCPAGMGCLDTCISVLLTRWEAYHPMQYLHQVMSAALRFAQAAAAAESAKSAQPPDAEATGEAGEQPSQQSPPAAPAAAAAPQEAAPEAPAGAASEADIDMDMVPDTQVMMTCLTASSTADVRQTVRQSANWLVPCNRVQCHLHPI